LGVNGAADKDTTDCCGHNFLVRHIRNLACPVTSRTGPRTSIQARFRWEAAHLDPVRVSAIEAEIRGHSVSTARKADGVSHCLELPLRPLTDVSAEKMLRCA